MAEQITCPLCGGAGALSRPTVHACPECHGAGTVKNVFLGLMVDGRYETAEETAAAECRPIAEVRAEARRARRWIRRHRRGQQPAEPAEEGEAMLIRACVRGVVADGEKMSEARALEMLGKEVQQLTRCVELMQHGMRPGRGGQRVWRCYRCGEWYAYPRDAARSSRIGCAIAGAHVCQECLVAHVRKYEEDQEAFSGLCLQLAMAYVFLKDLRPQIEECYVLIPGLAEQVRWNQLHENANPQSPCPEAQAAIDECK